jgi:hypothetical protein
MTIADLLDRADRNRIKVSARLAKTPESLAGIDDLLAYFEEALRVVSSNENLKELECLVRRVHEDIEVAVVSTYCGMIAVAVDACRDIMEIELLLREFALVPAAIKAWHNADERERWRRFRPAVLREAQAKRKGVDVKDLQDSKDYGNHSAGLHVSPLQMLWRRGVVEDQRPWLESDFAVVEVIEHGAQLIDALLEVTEALAKGALKQPETTSDLCHAAELVRQGFVPEYAKVVDELFMEK